MAWIVGLWPGSRTTTGPVPGGTCTGEEEVVGRADDDDVVDRDEECELDARGCVFDTFRVGDVDAGRGVVDGMDVDDGAVDGRVEVGALLAEVVVALVGEPALLHPAASATATSAMAATVPRPDPLRRRWCATAEL